MLYLFSGLPGTGKSTLSSALARALGAVYLRVDVVEHACGRPASASKDPRATTCVMR
nr:AAA family ATPase [Paenibacillus sp. UNC496MF]